MKIDIDKLHKVIESEYHPRNSGKTFTTICNLANTILVCEDKNIIFYVNRLSEVGHLVELMRGIFPHFGINRNHIEYLRPIFIVKCLNKTIFFVKEVKALTQNYIDHIEIRDYDYYERLEQESRDKASFLSGRLINKFEKKRIIFKGDTEVKGW